MNSPGVTQNLLWFRMWLRMWTEGERKKEREQGVKCNKWSHAIGKLSGRMMEKQRMEKTVKDMSFNI